MKFQVLTLFPEMVLGALNFGVIGQAIKQNLINITALSPREFTTNVHHTIDDRPFGGGDGMIMMPEPAALALEAMTQVPRSRRLIHLSPRGRTLSDSLAMELASAEEIILISSRYGGIDERYLTHFAIEEISIGDYVISGGELAALVLIDAVTRQVPGVLGNAASSEQESFRTGALEHPQYTRPREWRGRSVPKTLLSGDHAAIDSWKELVSLMVTIERRPDLIKAISPKTLTSVERMMSTLSDNELMELGIKEREVISVRIKTWIDTSINNGRREVDPKTEAPATGFAGQQTQQHGGSRS